MNDKEFILKFLNKNYQVSTDRDDFVLIDKINGGKYKNHEDSSFVLNTLIPIFHINNDFDRDIILIFQEWWDNGKNKISKSLYNIFDTMLPNISSRTVLYKILNKYKNSEHDSEFITRLFNQYFIDKWLNKYIDNYLCNVDKTLGSLRIVGDFNKLYPDQTSIIDNYIYKKLNLWYSENVLENIIVEFIENTTASLTRFDWVVEWKGRGIVERDFLIDYFPLENPYQLDKLKKVYDDIIIDSSSIHMKNH